MSNYSLQGGGPSPLALMPADIYCGISDYLEASDLVHLLEVNTYYHKQFSAPIYWHGKKIYDLNSCRSGQEVWGQYKKWFDLCAYFKQTLVERQEPKIGLGRLQSHCVQIANGRCIQWQQIWSLRHERPSLQRLCSIVKDHSVLFYKKSPELFLEQASPFSETDPEELKNLFLIKTMTMDSIAIISFVQKNIARLNFSQDDMESGLREFRDRYRIICSYCRLPADHKISKELLKALPGLIFLAKDEVFKDLNFIKKLILRIPVVFALLPEDSFLKADREIALLAIQGWGALFEFVGMKGLTELILAAITSGYLQAARSIVDVKTAREALKLCSACRQYFSKNLADRLAIVDADELTIEEVL